MHKTKLKICTHTHTHTHTHIYILIGKLKENSIKFQIEVKLESNFVPYVPSNLSF